MKNRLVLISLIVLFFSGNLFSQDCRDSAAADILAEKVRIGELEAILDAGNSGDKCLIPYLKIMAAKGSVYSQISLAKLGDEVALKEILDEFDSEIAEKKWDSSHRGMEKLSLVGGRIAFRKFYEVLIKLKPLPKVPDPEKKERNLAPDKYDFPMLYAYLNYLKMSALSYSQANGISLPEPIKSRPSNTWTDQIETWKKWFEEHPEVLN